MKQNIQVFQSSNSLQSRLLELNPQFFREIKGRLKTKNVAIAVAISVTTQFIVVISYMGELLNLQGTLVNPSGRYGTGISDYKDLLDNSIVNWQLFWLDLFLTLSVISICSLLVFGTYLLVADMVKEENRGTFDFIRLSPQSAGSILLGKILGVPILLYTGVLLMFPLHLVAGLNARIPLTLIIGFDAVVVASCAFFYSLALFWSLTGNKLSAFKPWLASGVVSFFLFTIAPGYTGADNPFNYLPFNWFFLFNPHLVLSYVVESTHLLGNKIEFISVDLLAEFLFYGQALWTKASLGIGFILFNFSVWTYLCWSILKRRFRNPETTLISKTQSYWLTGWLALFALGFTPQDPRGYQPICNFSFLLFFLCVWGMALIAALSPHRQALHDWSRYRHQAGKNSNIWQELVFADNSPSSVAVAINLAIAIAYTTPFIFLLLDADDEQEMFWGFILSASSILFCALIAQLILTIKTRKRAVWSTITVASMIIVPPICLGFLGIDPMDVPQAWLFTLFPNIAIEYVTTTAVVMTLFGQCLAISLAGLQMTRKLKQAGASETKALLS